MDAETVLVIILSIALAVFLTLAIILTFKLIKLTRRVDSIAGKAESAADNLVSISRVAKKSVQPAVIAGAFSQIIKKALGKKPAKKGRK